MTVGARETLLLYILLILGTLRIAMLTEKLEQLYGFHPLYIRRTFYGNWVQKASNHGLQFEIMA